MHNPGLHFATRGRRLPTHARGVPAPPCDRKGAYSAQEAAPLPALNTSSVGKSDPFFRQNAGTPRDSIGWVAPATGKVPSGSFTRGYASFDPPGLFLRSVPISP